MSEPYDNPAILSDADGSFSISFAAPERHLQALMDWDTREMTLVTGVVDVLSTRNPDAFAAGVRLLGAGALVQWNGWGLVVADAVTKDER